ncbi:MAG: ComF family protein [bacterium]|nr:ComF family protein [bacterium]
MNILDLLFPRRCLGCGKVGQYFCVMCRKKIRPIHESETICPVCEKPAMGGSTHPRCKTRDSIDGLTSFFHYDSSIKKAIKLLKYRFVRDVAGEFVSLIPKEAFEALSESTSRYRNSLIVPIPLHPSRLHFRGFNQAELLAGLIAERIHIPVEARCMKRIRRTTPQVEMKDRNERMKNMSGVFSFQKLPTMNHTLCAIILFDDVFTTGATMRSAATTLKVAGFPFVWGVTMAR